MSKATKKFITSDKQSVFSVRLGELGPKVMAKVSKEQSQGKESSKSKIVRDALRQYLSA